jgi:hypothetical protein
MDNYIETSKSKMEAPARKIEVEQRGLATGVVIAVRVIKRIKIHVQYIPS